MTDARRLPGDLRRQLTARYGELFLATSALLFRHDPADINFGDNIDEYDSEAGTMLPRLKDCHSVDDVRRVVQEEFHRWFDKESAGTDTQHAAIAEELWNLWRRPQPS